MDDITRPGISVRFALDQRLRGNPLERAELYEKLIAIGVLTVDEARRWEDLAPEGNA
jgi:phage portal protein BeeE